MSNLLDKIIGRQEAFWVKTHRSENGCLEWIGARNEKGYGVIGVPFNGRNITMIASRYAFMLRHNVLLSSTELVLHHCDNPPCVDGDHLFVGNRRANMADMITKGRQNYRFGRFSDEEIRDIRFLGFQEILQKQEIAAMFGVHPSMVTLILNGKRYGRVV